MNSAKEKSPTETLLDEMYKNVKMGADSLVNIMNRADDRAFREELTSQLNRYEGYAAKIGKMIYDTGSKPKEENPVTRFSAKVGMAMNTMVDSGTSHLAQMVIEGATMGITDLTRQVREHENTTCSESALSMAKDIIRFEEATVSTMKQYL